MADPLQTTIVNFGQHGQSITLGPHPEHTYNTVITFLIFHLFYFILPAACIIVPIYTILFTSYWHIMSIFLLIYIYFSFDGKERKYGKPWNKIVNWTVFRHMIAYFPCTIVRVGAELDPSQKYIFALHSHGVFAFCRAMLCFCKDLMFDKLFPGFEHKMRTLTASAPLYIPLIREVFLWSGCIDASRPVAEKNLIKGHSLFVFPGGEKEQIETQRGQDYIYIKHRKGFVRLALEQGAHLVPCFCFGDSDTFACSSIFLSLRHFIVDKLRVALPIFIGRWFTMIPFRVPLTFVIGEPIIVKPVERHEITQEQVNQLHHEYITRLVALYNEHKAQHGYADRELIIA